MFQNITDPSQLQPGDKMTMAFHKSPKPPVPDYLKNNTGFTGGQLTGPVVDGGQPPSAGMPGPAADPRQALMAAMARNRPV